MGRDAGEHGEQRGKFYFRGGSLALDFTNTVGNRLDLKDARDYIQDFSDLADWARVAGVPFASATPGEAPSGQLQRALHIRELVYRILSHEARGAAPGRQDLDEFGRVLKKSRDLRVLLRTETPEGVVYSWSFRRPVSVVESLLSTILEDTAMLLSSPQLLARLRICADDTCGWLFLDCSRPGKRRWCSMADCGNRAKARRHYHRRRA